MGLGFWSSCNHSTSETAQVQAYLAGCPCDASTQAMIVAPAAVLSTRARFLLDADVWQRLMK